jgi:NADH-ubiquinone oxidoreductase chain 4
LLLYSLLFIPLTGIFLIANTSYLEKDKGNFILSKYIALSTSVINLAVSFIIFVLFNNSTNQFQFVDEHYNVKLFDVYLGIDGISIYFILLTTIIIPIALLSNWDSIKENVKSYLIIILLLETLLLAVFLVLDILLFYIFFESVLPPLFILIGLFGSKNKVRASYYFFLYTL